MTDLHVEESMRQYCLDRYGEVLSQHISYVPTKCTMLDATDYEELIKQGNIATKNMVPGITVSKERWMAYTRMTEWMASSRHIKSKRMLIGTILINNLYFMWDDLSDDLVKRYHLDACKETRRLVETYFEVQYRAHVLQELLNWLVIDTKLRKTETSKKLYNTSLHTYWQVRVMESGCHGWLSLSAPIYQDEGHIEWLKLMIPSMLTVKALAFINDVISYDKEEEQDENPNALYFVDIHDREKFTAFFEMHLKEIEQDLCVIKTLPEPTQSICLEAIYGHYLWAKDTPRYKKGVNRYNKVLSVKVF